LQHVEIHKKLLLIREDKLKSEIQERESEIDDFRVKFNTNLSNHKEYVSHNEQEKRNLVQELHALNCRMESSNVLLGLVQRIEVNHVNQSHRIALDELVRQNQAVIDTKTNLLVRKEVDICVQSMVMHLLEERITDVNTCIDKIIKREKVATKVTTKDMGTVTDIVVTKVAVSAAVLSPAANEPAKTVESSSSDAKNVWKKLNSNKINEGSPPPMTPETSGLMAAVRGLSFKQKNENETTSSEPEKPVAAATSMLGGLSRALSFKGDSSKSVANSSGKGSIISSVKNLFASNVTEEEAVVLQDSTAKNDSVGGTAAEVATEVAAEVSDSQMLLIESYEERIHDFTQELTSLVAEKNKLVEDKAFVSQQLQELIAEKRTDVVKRLQDQVSSLEEQNYQLTLSQASIKAMNTKLENTSKELEWRCNSLESEVRERDRVELENLGEANEKYALKTLINKQREDIAMKSKVATSGWDALASMEEKVESEVAKAFRLGQEEIKNANKTDFKAIMESLEVKETRITQLMVEVGNYKQRLRENDEIVEKMKAQVAETKQELADTIATFADSRGNGGDDDEMVSKDELESAHEELGRLEDRCSQLERTNAKNEELLALYERLVSGRRDSAVGASKTATSSSNANVDKAIADTRNAINNGTVLWKNNKRDEVYEIYSSACTSIAKALPSYSLITQTLKDVQRESKIKAALIMRKSLDKFLADYGSDTSKSTDAAASVAVDTNKNTSEVETSLLAQISTLKKKDEQAIPEVVQSSEDDAPAAASSLLRRAKEAEKQVDILKKQLLQALEQASSDTSGGTKGDKSKEGGAANPIEVRKLTRKVKELEEKLAKGGGGVGVGGGGGEGNEVANKKLLAQTEKKYEKRIKELETSFRKEKDELTRKLTTLETNTSSMNDVLTERNRLRDLVQDYDKLREQVESNKQLAERYRNLEVELSSRTSELTGMASLLSKESALRRKYKNELEDLKGAIRVYARVRPLAKYEIEKGCKSIVDFPSDTSVIVKGGRGDKEYEFDAAFNSNVSQDAVFEDARRLVESCLDGFNVCCFAYGQTGSGKTFTMTGTPSNPGLTPKAINEMWRLFAERPQWNYKVSTYFVELYNDNVIDLFWLLDNKRNLGKQGVEPPKLDIKMDAKKLVYIRNVVMKEAATAADLMNLFTTGNLERHVGATKMNAESSRSHSIFSIVVEGYDTTTKKTVTGKLSLVDLAGSERADKTGAEAERLKEAQSINKSLSALGDVIAALSEGEKFIPYRNNKLTQLMQDSLGGNAKTLMFVNFSPADYNGDETVTSLNYATRVKKIINNAAKQQESEEVARLKGIIKQLRQGKDVDEGEGVSE
jgi:DNA repair exonuclease SbcCD ATPase subunit